MVATEDWLEDSLATAGCSLVEKVNGMLDAELRRPERKISTKEEVLVMRIIENIRTAEGLLDVLRAEIKNAE